MCVYVCVQEHICVQVQKCLYVHWDCWVCVFVYTGVWEVELEGLLKINLKSKHLKCIDDIYCFRSVRLDLAPFKFLLNFEKKKKKIPGCLNQEVCLRSNIVLSHFLISLLSGLSCFSSLCSLNLLFLPTFRLWLWPFLCVNLNSPS